MSFVSFVGHPLASNRIHSHSHSHNPLPGIHFKIQYISKRVHSHTFSFYVAEIDSFFVYESGISILFIKIILTLKSLGDLNTNKNMI